MSKAQQIAPTAKIVGSVEFRGPGRIIVQDRVRLSGQPAPSHLAAGPEGQVSVGASSVISFGAAIYAAELVEIGEGTQIGPYAAIADSDFHAVGDRNKSGRVAPIRIGKRVRIGARVTILPGSTIGDDVEVLSGCVVSSPIESGATVGGVPARPVGSGFSAPSGQATTVEEVFRRVFGLPNAPPTSAGPDQIPGWDSLGSLRVLLALEETFGVLLDQSKIAKAKTVGEVASLIDASR